MTEWIEWCAGPSRLLLEDGREVSVEDGDLLLASIDDGDAVAFLDHDPANRTVH